MSQQLRRSKRQRLQERSDGGASPSYSPPPRKKAPNRVCRRAIAIELLVEAGLPTGEENVRLSLICRGVHARALNAAIPIGKRTASAFLRKARTSRLLRAELGLDETRRHKATRTVLERCGRSVIARELLDAVGLPTSEENVQLSLICRGVHARVLNTAVRMNRRTASAFLHDARSSRLLRAELGLDETRRHKATRTVLERCGRSVIARELLDAVGLPTSEENVQLSLICRGVHARVLNTAVRMNRRTASAFLHDARSSRLLRAELGLDETRGHEATRTVLERFGRSVIAREQRAKSYVASVSK